MPEIKPVARIKSLYPGKFGIPRQSLLVPSPAEIIFEPEFAVAEAVRGLEQFSHIWLIWGFSEAERKSWSPTVRPPRLGGNVRMGVFATRSPYRPNSLGLSVVELCGIELTDGVRLKIKGADLMDGTPVYDIKPYLPYADSLPQANGGFAERVKGDRLSVIAPEDTENIPPDTLDEICEIVASDPRPRYAGDSERIYGFEYGVYHIEFRCDGETATVLKIEKQGEKNYVDNPFHR